MPQIVPQSLTSLPGSDAHEPRMTRGKLCPRCQTLYTEDAEEGNFCARDGMALLESERIFASKYVLGEHLGFGQMGDVFSATQAGVGRQVALKILRADHVDNHDMVKRFEHEAQIASSIDHPNAVTIFESGRSNDGQAYIAMELLDGETLERRLQSQGPLGTQQALELLLPAIRAIAAAHGRGVVHRDLKPDNIFIARKQTGAGPDEVVKVLDFGIAGRVTSMTRPTPMNIPLGTPLYMAPEQLQNAEATLRSDVFALGVILTEVLTGRLPWGETAATTTSTATMARIVRPPCSLVELLPGGDFPEALQSLINQMLARDPQQRPADASAVLRSLQQIALALHPGIHPALISARHLPLGQATLPPPIDSTATLSGRETKPLAMMLPVRKRWLVGATVLMVAGVVALLWSQKQSPGTKGLGKSAAPTVNTATADAPVRLTLPTLVLPHPAGASRALEVDSEPPPAGFTAPPKPSSPTLLSQSSSPAPDLGAESSRRRHHRHQAQPESLERPRHHHHRARAAADLKTGIRN